MNNFREVHNTVPDQYGPVVLITRKKFGIKQQHCNKI